MKTTREELLLVLGELGRVFPDWRFGQLVANVASSTEQGANAAAIWDCEDDELLSAARRLLERNRSRVQIPA